MSEGRGFGIYIKVRNLDACRTFYRDLLELGTPIIDSNFWVEFAIGDGLRLVLEKSAATYLEHAASATSFILYTDGIERLIERLAEHGYNPQPVEMARPGATFYRCLDPEDNLIHLARGGR